MSAETFDRIYRNGVWSHGATAPASGPGSRPSNCLPVLWEIMSFIDSRRNRKVSILDIGCGDMSFMAPVLASPLGGWINYTGMDISKIALSMAYSNSPDGANLVKCDASAEDFSAIADLIIVKDICFHLENLQIKQLLLNLNRSHYRRLIINTDPGAPNERVLNEYHWASVDLEGEYFGPLLAKLGHVAARHPRPEHGEYLVITR